MPMNRLFIALWPSAVVTESLDIALEPLRREYADLRWQPTTRWHITVAFLGQRDESRAREQFARIQTVTPGPMSVASAGRFGPVLYAGIDTGTWIETLVDAARRTCRVQERRTYRPHITLARARNQAASQQAHAAARELAGYRGPAWVPDSITLVRSTLGPDPAYEVIAASDLPQPA